MLEERLANLLPNGGERNIARRGAIAAAKAARNEQRAADLCKCWKGNSAVKSEDERVGITYDLLQEKAEKLVALLKERQIGMFTWHMLLNESLKGFHDLLCPLLRKD